MFSAVWQACRDEIVFGFAMLGYAGVAGLAAIGSTTWIELLSPCLLAALPFALFSRLRRFASSALLIVVCGLAVVGGGELLFRVRYFGSDALAEFRGYSPNSVVTMPGMTRVSPDPGLQYILAPGAETTINGDPWRINSRGFRDSEVVAQKPPGTFRIATTGDSFVMGAFVAIEDRFTSQLERLLNEERVERFEVVNLGLAALRLRDAAHLMETEALRIDADLVLATLRASQVDEKLPPQAERPRMTAADLEPPDFSFPRRYSFLLDIHRPAVIEALARLRGLATRWIRFGPAAAQPGSPLQPTYPELIERSLAFTREHGVPVALVVLRKIEFAGDTSLRAAMARAVLGDPTRKADHRRAGELAAEAGVDVIDTYDAFPADSRRSELIVFPGDDHPNALGHAYYARTIADWIDANAARLGLAPK